MLCAESLFSEQFQRAEGGKNPQEGIHISNVDAERFPLVFQREKFLLMVDTEKVL